MLPEMFSDYLKFVKLRDLSGKTGRIDLSKQTWMYPTTLLPLCTYIVESRLPYTPPSDKSLASYFDHITRQQTGFCATGKTYMPLTILPPDRKKAEGVLEELFKIPKIGSVCGGEQAFKYMVSELVDNIYEHSGSTIPCLIAQKYPNKGFVDISIMDNGITIPGSFQKFGMVFPEDAESLIEAINGLSTKDEQRGFGLPSCIKIFTKGMKGKVMIVSRNGALLLGNGKNKAFKLSEGYRLNGTLVTIRAPISRKMVDIYEYLQ